MWISVLLFFVSVCYLLSVWGGRRVWHVSLTWCDLAWPRCPDTQRPRPCGVTQEAPAPPALTPTPARWVHNDHALTSLHPSHVWGTAGQYPTCLYSFMPVMDLKCYMEEVSALSPRNTCVFKVSIVPDTFSILNFCTTYVAKYPLSPISPILILSEQNHYYLYNRYRNTCLSSYT